MRMMNDELNRFNGSYLSSLFEPEEPVTGFKEISHPSLTSPAQIYGSSKNMFKVIVTSTFQEIERIFDELGNLPSPFMLTIA